MERAVAAAGDSDKAAADAADNDVGGAEESDGAAVGVAECKKARVASLLPVIEIQSCDRVRTSSFHRRLIETALF